jgi:hypothetical protein
MNNRDSSRSKAATYCNTSCNCLLCDFDPEYEARLERGRALDAFYAELGWDAQQQADFFYETLCIEKLSKDELRILLNLNIQDFISKCHPLLLALLSSDEGGASGEI